VPASDTHLVISAIPAVIILPLKKAISSSFIRNPWILCESFSVFYLSADLIKTLIKKSHNPVYGFEIPITVDDIELISLIQLIELSYSINNAKNKIN